MNVQAKYEELPWKERVNVIKEAVKLFHCDKEPFEYMQAHYMVLGAAIVHYLEYSLKVADTLIACVERGPVWEGDVPSKRQRGILMDLGLVQPVLVKGEFGYAAATHSLGHLVNAGKEFDKLGNGEAYTHVVDFCRWLREEVRKDGEYSSVRYPSLYYPCVSEFLQITLYKLQKHIIEQGLVG